MLVVEDGTGLPNSQSYVSVAEVRAYGDARGSAIVNSTGPTPATDTPVEQALVRANQYIDFQYRERFRGIKNTLAQAMAWPRWGARVDATSEGIFYPGVGTQTPGYVLASNLIPQMLKDAVCEACIREIQSPGSLSPDIATGSAAVISEKVDTIEVHYAQGRTPFKVFRIVDMLLAPILQYSGTQRQIVRG